MPKIRKDTQNAQGMVEFALALPVLLLLVLGVIGFGHLFFSYASVVSASREAARFGAAVGVVEGSSTPRYMACNNIRQAGSQVAVLAGVTPASIAIQYDGGPGTALVSPSCPPANADAIDSGDRIVVTTSIQYRSIVPLVNIPPITLEATTARTIVKSMAIGAGIAPTAESVCSPTTIDILADVEPSVVGQPVNYTVNVNALTPPNPTNADSIAFDDVSNGAGWETEVLDAPTSTFGPVTYTSVGMKDLLADYDGWQGVDPCYWFSITAFSHEVIKADTETILTSSPTSTQKGARYNVSVQVNVLAPGAGVPTGRVTITGSDGSTCTTGNLNSTGYASCQLRPPNTYLGGLTITGTYDGDDNFNASTSAPINHVIFDPSTPSVEPSVVVTTTTTTPEPSCPTASTIDFAAQDDGFHFDITKPRAGTDAPISSIRVEWPSDPEQTITTLLNEIRFDGSNNIANSCDASFKPSQCVWKNNTSGLTSGLPAQSGVDFWSGATVNNGSTTEMRMVFSRSISNGSYRVVINFSNGCPALEVTGNRQR